MPYLINKAPITERCTAEQVRAFKQWRKKQRALARRKLDNKLAAMQLAKNLRGDV